MLHQSASIVPKPTWQLGENKLLTRHVSSLRTWAYPCDKFCLWKYHDRLCICHRWEGFETTKCHNQEQFKIPVLVLVNISAKKLPITPWLAPSSRQLPELEWFVPVPT